MLENIIVVGLIALAVATGILFLFPDTFLLFAI